MDTHKHPRLRADALYGLAGDFVRIIEPATEADSAALLLQFMAAIGNVIGRSGRVVVDGSTIYLNLFVMLVGATARGRKGTALAHVQNALRLLDEDWAENRVIESLVSGQGLLSLVRDPLEEKRLLVVLPEARGLFQACRIRGNILPDVLRNAADGRRLDNPTRSQPLRATGAHISLIGHITAEELEAVADPIALSSGFANRILWIVTNRSKSLPLGGNLDLGAVSTFQSKLLTVVTTAREFTDLSLSAPAVELYKAVYEELGDGLVGVAAGLIARGPTHVLRLAGLFAVLDASTVISPDHMKAALSIWEFSRESAAWVAARWDFASLDRELLELFAVSSSLSKGEVYKHFNGHRSVEVRLALRRLEGQGKLRRQWRGTGGRPAEQWSVVPEKVVAWGRTRSRLGREKREKRGK